MAFFRRSPWPRGRRRESTAARLLGLRVRIPQGAWMSVSWVLFFFCQVEVSATGNHSSRGVLPTVVCLSVMEEPYRGGLGPLWLLSYGKEMYFYLLHFICLVFGGIFRFRCLFLLHIPLPFWWCDWFVQFIRIIAGVVNMSVKTSDVYMRSLLFQDVTQRWLVFN